MDYRRIMSSEKRLDMGEGIYLSDVGLITFHPEASKGEPDLQRTEPSAQCETPVTVIDDGT